MVNPKFHLMLFFIVLYMGACWCLEADPDKGMELTPNPTASDTPLPTPTYTLDIFHVLDICDDYEKKEMSIVIYDIVQGDTSFTMYVKIPGGVYALNGGDKEDFEFSAQMGRLESLECKVYEGEQYMDRLYCFFPFNSDYKNTAQPFALYLADCPNPIFSHPAVSLMVEEVSAPPKPESACGPEPTDCGAAHEIWCLCDGGLFSGCVEGTPVCFYP
jgi:hypothetical protein